MLYPIELGVPVGLEIRRIVDRISALAAGFLFPTPKILRIRFVVAKPPSKNILKLPFLPVRN